MCNVDQMPDSTFIVFIVALLLLLLLLLLFVVVAHSFARSLVGLRLHHHQRFEITRGQLSNYNVRYKVALAAAAAAAAGNAKTEDGHTSP